MTEVDTNWLDRIVTAHQGLQLANKHLRTLTTLVRHGDDTSHTYNENADDALMRDGTNIRLQAMRNRVATIEYDLRQAECHGTTVGPILISTREVLEALNETILNTEALLADTEQEPDDGDPTIDRLEEHPAYERN